MNREVCGLEYIIRGMEHAQYDKRDVRDGAEHLRNLIVKFGNRVQSQEMMNIDKDTANGAQGVQDGISSTAFGNRA